MDTTAMAEAAPQPLPTGPLPSGRHGLSREHVVASQRARMLAALAETMMENGYAGTPVAEIIRRAGVSRETFYQQFRSKQDCFVQALDAGMDGLARLLEPARSHAPPLDAFRALLRVYLHALADSPALARVFLVEVYAAGPEAVGRRRELQARFADALAEVFTAASAEDRFACEALVAATAQLVTTHLVAEDLDGLRGLEEPLVALAGRLFD